MKQQKEKIEEKRKSQFKCLKCGSQNIDVCYAYERRNRYDDGHQTDSTWAKLETRIECRNCGEVDGLGDSDY